ncbi:MULTISPECIES: nucleotidyl transferase AbiEii/AbiGii toxin family protein [unclassified Methylobacterium]|uniref:nucleotidyl transferase AbiEii/AbiGii toxin family protein n=1 Tax=unclassified Methylobacterium TaxID=2615210 RepID=UPI0005BBB07C|nr:MULTISPECIES: nucleotidyl transferase AbiEii/AbiGii toxin family protein [unclassified Methylobacterium]SFU50487.1 Nucleotidyl transferase AbiEii toxin, Type IV TA system [Methylobacterium sp. UNCCL125]
MAKDTNLAALQAAARARNLPLATVCQRYAMERLFGRVFASGHADRFAVKGGAIVFLAEGVHPLDGRSTSDVDLQLPAFEGTMQEFEGIMREILAGDGADGVAFDLSTWSVKAEREAGSIGGGSVTVQAVVGGQRIRVKVDVAFDERSKIADLVEVLVPSVLGGEPVRIRAVPFAHTAADKIQAMLRHGPKTYRLRDHYDLFVMLTRGHARLDEVAAALPASLAAFGIPLPADADGIPALAEAHVEPRRRAWEAERASRRFSVATPEWGDLNARLRELVGDVLERCHASRPGLAA